MALSKSASVKSPWCLSVEGECVEKAVFGNTELTPLRLTEL